MTGSCRPSSASKNSKKEKNAIILAHNYVAPEILYGVADHTGDSYGLAKIARQSTAEVIVFPAVRFMAETAKVLSPHKTVLDPNPNGGCSLADGINAGDVRRLRKEYPDHTFVCYINTTADNELAFMYLHMVQEPTNRLSGNSDCKIPVRPHSVSRKKLSPSDSRTWLSMPEVLPT